MTPRRPIHALLTAAALSAALAGTGLVSGCEEDHTFECAAAYDHLLEVGKRYPNEALRASFIDACRTAWDLDRVACLMVAKTPEEALACRPKKIKPG